MRRWVILSRYHWTVLVAFAALSGLALAWISFGLLRLAMANAEFVSTYGVMGLRDGGFLQAVGLGLRGLLALGCYLVFKAMEAELIARWRGYGR